MRPSTADGQSSRSRVFSLEAAHDVVVEEEKADDEPADDSVGRAESVDGRSEAAMSSSSSSSTLRLKTRHFEPAVAHRHRRPPPALGQDVLLPLTETEPVDLVGVARPRSRVADRKEKESKSIWPRDALDTVEKGSPWYIRREAHIATGLKRHVTMLRAAHGIGSKASASAKRIAAGGR